MPTWPGNTIGPDEPGDIKRGLRHLRGPSLPEHKLLKRQKISEIFWKPPARSFSFILPFLKFFRIGKDEKVYNALRKTLKLVENLIPLKS